MNRFTEIAEKEKQEYIEYLHSLAPVGVMRECIKLYQAQTIEWMKTKKLSQLTYFKIIQFDAYCSDNNYENFIIVPLQWDEYFNKQNNIK